MSRGLPGSFVIARSTAFTYKRKPINAKQIGRDLGVRYMLEGSIASDGDRVRVNATVIDTETEAHLWAERFEKSKANLLELQDEIVARLARSVGLRVIDDEARRAKKARATNLDAADLAMRGWSVRYRPSSPENNREARDFFHKALQIDPIHVDALVGLATTHIVDVLNSYYPEGREDRLRRADEALSKALELDPRHAAAVQGRCLLLRAQQRFEEAIRACEASSALNPADPNPHKEIGFDLIYLGRADQSIPWFERANRLAPQDDPQRFTWFSGLGQAHFLIGQDEKAIGWLRRTIEANPRFGIAYAYLAAAHAMRGEQGEAERALAEFRRLNPGFSIASLLDARNSANQIYLQQRERLREGLSKAGFAN